MDKDITIVTHNGSFHTDDVFAVATLLLVFKNKPVIARIIRTRDAALIESGDFVVDVGTIYDEQRERFDHHQIGGAGARENGVPYAAFGLVWKKYGGLLMSSPEAVEMIDETLVQYVDAMDNGTGELTPIIAGVVPYSVREVISSFNPTWEEGSVDDDLRFSEAVNCALQILEREIKTTESFVKGDMLVRKAYEAAKDKRIVVLEKNYLWEKVLNQFSEPLFVVEPTTEGWKVYAVKDNPALFVNRKDLPLAWAGKRDAELAGVSGVPDAVFCHNKRFMAVTKSKEGAIALAQEALKSS